MGADLAGLPEALNFGKFAIPKAHVFAASAYSFAFVNLKPVTPGHVLVAPRNVIARFGDLSLNEVADLWQLAQAASKCVEAHHSADSMTVVIQDGPAAGQTVPHVHIHCLPRHFEDIENNDEIYDMIDKASKADAAARGRRAKPLGDLDEERTVRSSEQMAEEATALRQSMPRDNVQT